MPHIRDEEEQLQVQGIGRISGQVGKRGMHLDRVVALSLALGCLVALRGPGTDALCQAIRVSLIVVWADLGLSWCGSAVPDPDLLFMP